MVVHNMQQVGAYHSEYCVFQTAFHPSGTNSDLVNIKSLAVTRRRCYLLEGVAPVAALPYCGGNAEMVVFIDCILGQQKLCR